MPPRAGSRDLLARGTVSHRTSTDPSSPSIQESGIQNVSQEPLAGSRRTIPSDATSSSTPASNNPRIHTHVHVGQKLQHSSTSATSTLPSPSLTNEPSPSSTSSIIAEVLSLPASVPMVAQMPALGSGQHQPIPFTVCNPDARESSESDSQGRTERLSRRSSRLNSQPVAAATLPAEHMQPSVARGQKEAEDDDVIMIGEHSQKRIRQVEGRTTPSVQCSIQEGLERCRQLLNQRIQDFKLLSDGASSIESDRLIILRDACAHGDLFYVVLHRFFCLWTIEPLRALAAFGIDPALTDIAFRQLSSVMGNNKDIPAIHLAWLSNFPELLPHIARFGEVCVQIAVFLGGFATEWKPLLDEIVKRRHPMLVWEARTRLKCQSKKLENILFVSSYKSIGIGDGPFAPDLRDLFAKDQMKERELAQQKTTPDQVKIARELMTGFYKALVSRAEHEQQVTREMIPLPDPGSQSKLPPQSPNLRPLPSQSSQLPSALQLPLPPPPPPEASRPYQQQQQPNILHQSPTNPNQTMPIISQAYAVPYQLQSFMPPDSRTTGGYYGPNHPLQLQANGSTSARPAQPVYQGSQPGRNSTPLSSNSGQTASTLGSVTNQNPRTQLHSLRYSVPVTNTERLPSSNHPVAAACPQTLQRRGFWPAAAAQHSIPIALQDQQMLSTASVPTVQTQAQIRPQDSAQVQSQTPTQTHVHVPAHQYTHLQPPQGVQYHAQAPPMQPILPSFIAPTFQSSVPNLGPLQGVSNHASLVTPVQHGAVLTPPNHAMQQMRPSQLGEESQPSRPQFTTHELNVNEHPSGVHDYSSLQSGLHLIHLRSPRRVPATLNRTRYYQFFDKWLVSPRVLKPQIPVITVQFDLPDTRPNIPSSSTCPNGLPVSRYFNKCHRFRLRLCQRRENQAAMNECTWAISKSHWPSDIYISFNKQPQILRRKQHFHHDLPIELTDLVTSGKNFIQISLPKRPENTLLGTVYLVAVERIVTLNHDTVWSWVNHGQQHITIADTKLVIEKRLRPSDSDDIVVENDTLIVSVVDPFSSRICDVPVRGPECKHLECIDLRNWLETRPSKSPQQGMQPGMEPTMVDVWNCPICGLDARPNSLHIDDFFVDICQKLREGGNTEVKKIQISADGTWVPVQEPENIQNLDRNLATAETTQRGSIGPTGSVPETIEILDDDD